MAVDDTKEGVKRRRVVSAIVAILSVLAFGVLAAGLLWISLGGELEPFELMDRDDGPRVGLTAEALAQSCEDTPRPDCESLIGATCWDGPDGLTMHVCLTTPASSVWERQDRPYELPATFVKISESGEHLLFARALLNRDGSQIQSENARGEWLGHQERRIVTDGEGATIFELDGTVVESIKGPEPDWQWPGEHTLGVSHDHNKIAAFDYGMSSGRLWLYDRTDREWTLLVDDPDYMFLPFVTDMGFSEDDTHIITVQARLDSDDGRTVDPTADRPIRLLRVVRIAVDDGSVELVRAVETDSSIRSSVSPDGRLVAVTNGRGQTRVLNVESGEVSDRVATCCPDYLYRWTPNGSFLVTPTGDIVGVQASKVPAVDGPYILEPPDPHDVNLPLVRPQAS
jgi:hypothetical protein